MRNGFLGAITALLAGASLTLAQRATPHTPLTSSDNVPTAGAANSTFVVGSPVVPAKS